MKVYDQLIMVLDVIAALLEKPFINSFKLFDQYLIANFLNFIKGFEIAIFTIIAIVFLLIATGVAIRQAKRLPKSYMIEITDVCGRPASIDGLRQTFSTYEAAESYARFYSDVYKQQSYKFKVVGSKTPLTQVNAIDGSRG